MYAPQRSQGNSSHCETNYCCALVTDESMHAECFHQTSNSFAARLAESLHNTQTNTVHTIHHAHALSDTRINILCVCHTRRHPVCLVEPRISSGELEHSEEVFRSISYGAS